MLDIEKYLVHLADIYHVGRSGTSTYSNGSNTLLATPVSDVPVYAYFGDQVLIQDVMPEARTVFSSPTKWQVILPYTLANVLKVGAKVANIRDENGDVIREDGYVDDMNVYRHHRYGAMCVLVKLS